MTPPDLDALDALAKAATPGPWFRATVEQEWVAHAFGEPCPGDGRAEFLIADVTASPGDGDAAYIAAAHPSAILALTARVRAAEQRAEAARLILIAARGVDPAPCPAVDALLDAEGNWK